MEFFLKHKIVILRSAGALMLLIGFVIHFWAIPKSAVSVNEIAAANVARIEASVSGHTTSTKKAKPDMSTFSESLTKAQAQKTKYLTILAMVFGVLFLGYSFLKKEED